MVTQGQLPLPEDLKLKIANIAKENNHSMNAEIFSCLEKCFEQKFRDLDDVPLEMVIGCCYEKAWGKFFKDNSRKIECRKEHSGIKNN